MLINGVKFGITLTVQMLRDQITAGGWEIKKCKFDSKRDRYLVSAKNEHGEELERGGKSEQLALSNLLVCITQRNSRYQRLASWDTHFTDQMEAVAEAYMKAPIYDAKAAAAFTALGKDSERRADVLREHLQIRIVNDPEPYKNSQKLVDDIRKKRQLLVSRAGIDHPVWSDAQVLAYRICHDVLGYAAADAGWDWAGENLAFTHHAEHLSEEAQKALFCESIASTAYVAYYRAYSPEKVALFPQFMNKAQERENPRQKYPGLHPQDSYAPVAMPSIKPITSAKYEPLVGPFADPNYGWQSKVEPIQIPTGNADGSTMTPAVAFGDPLDPEGGRELAANLASAPSAPNGWAHPQDAGLAQRMDQNVAQGGPAFTDQEWSYLQTEAPDELVRMKKAVSNAIRGALFSPRNKLHDNALHVQEISHIPPGTTDPYEYHNHLSARRNEYNIGRREQRQPGRGEEDRDSHLPYRKLITPFTKMLQQTHDLSPVDAMLETRRQLAKYRWEEETKIKMEQGDVPPEKQLYPFEVESACNTQTAKRMELRLKEHKAGLDKAAARKVPPKPTQPPGFDTRPEEEQPGPGVGAWAPNRYPAWFYSMSVDVSRMEEHIDDLTKAALEDVHNHSGQGYHFRQTLIALNIPNIGPKIASFSWLLLQPLTSELATMDTHMMQIMGEKTAPGAREYYMQERTLADRRNAAGYGDIPLGQFQWLMWDQERTGVHQDHTALRPVDPTHWGDVTWHKAGESDPNWGPSQEWWNMTKGVEQPMIDDWMAKEGQKVPPDQTPYQGQPDGYGLPTPDQPADGVSVYSKISAAQLTPWYTHPQTGEHVMGRPGQSIMAHLVESTGLSLPEIWGQFGDDGVGKI
jgi:hypothetical protein